MRKGSAKGGKFIIPSRQRFPPTPWSLVSDWQVTSRLKLLAGISNLTDRQYYNRVWQTGLEPAYGRTWYAGFELKM